MRGLGRPLEQTYNLANLQKVLTPKGGQRLLNMHRGTRTLGHKKNYSISTQRGDPLSTQLYYNSADESRGANEYSIDSLSMRGKPQNAMSPKTAKTGAFNLPSLK